MGWVEKRFTEELAYTNGIEALWNAVRDSVAVAVQEFNKRTNAGVIRNDCRARGQYCIRVAKGGPKFSSIEIFLDEEERWVKASVPSEPETVQRVCGYRLKKDAPSLEFFRTDSTGDNPSLSVDDVCELALGDFLFK